MAKRRAEDTLFHDAPSKRCYRSLCGIDMQLGSMVDPKSPSSLLALLGSRCRKRPYYFEDPEQQQQQQQSEEEAPLHRKTTQCCDTRKHGVFTVPNSASLQERGSSIKPPNSKKRPRDHSVGSETVSKANDEADADNTTEDSTFNSFQYWRVPLPELDLSLLEDASAQSQTKDKPKVKNSSDAMET